MEPRRITVFFYGLFMDVGLLCVKGVNPTEARPGCVPGFAPATGQNNQAGGIFPPTAPAEEELFPAAYIHLPWIPMPGSWS